MLWFAKFPANLADIHIVRFNFQGQFDAPKYMEDDKSIEERPRPQEHAAEAHAIHEVPQRFPDPSAFGILNPQITLEPIHSSWSDTITRLVTQVPLHHPLDPNAPSCSTSQLHQQSQFGFPSALRLEECNINAAVRITGLKPSLGAYGRNFLHVFHGKTIYRLKFWLWFLKI